MLHWHVQVCEILGASCILESHKSLPHVIRVLCGLYGGLMLGWVVGPIGILEACFAHLVLESQVGASRGDGARLQSLLLLVLLLVLVCLILDAHLL